MSLQNRVTSVTAGCMLDAFDNNEFFAAIIYGPLGYGKTTFTFKALLDAYGIPHDRKAVLTEDQMALVKDAVVYTAKEFLDKVFRDRGQRKLCLIWDDAGVGLFNLDTWDPFVKLVTKWMNVVRTQYAAVLFTSPSPMYMVRKIRNIPQMVHIKITKINGGPRHERQAQAYITWTNPDFVGHGVKKPYIEYFNVMMPDNLYKWYLPYRQSYADGLLDEAYAEYNKVRQKGVIECG